MRTARRSSGRRSPSASSLSPDPVLTALFVGVALFLAFIWFSVLTAPEPAAAEGAEGETRILYDTVVENAANGPLYNLPAGYTQYIVVDRSNRAYILVTHGDSIAVIPYLDENGKHKVIDNA